ncbi:MAG: hypothetical protein LBM62_04750 [Mediterranea sp.]|jgi:hypothetical protein|nr:hypothetical protein [Mediterranea sp.]
MKKIVLTVAVVATLLFMKYGNLSAQSFVHADVQDTGVPLYTESEKDEIIRIVLGVFVLYLLGGVVVIGWYQRQLLQKERTIKKQEIALSEHQLRIYENEASISHNQLIVDKLMSAIDSNDADTLEAQNAIKTMQEQNQTLQEENAVLQHQIDEQASTLTRQSRELQLLKTLSQENSELRIRTELLYDKLSAQMEVVCELKTAPKCLTPTRWVKVRDAVNYIYDNFTDRLYRCLPTLSENEIKLCCLIKLHLPLSTIATLLGIAPESVSKQKLRLKEHIARDMGAVFNKERNLDVLIWEI